MRQIVLLLLSLPSFAALPPVPEAIRQVFSGRKEAPTLEAVLAHRVEIKQGEALDLEERIIRDGATVFSLWKGAGLSKPLLVSREKEGYDAGGGKQFRIRSHLFTKYFLFSSPENFKEQLIQEQFVRRDQCIQFRTHYNPTGDPRLWNVKEGYLHHSDIAIHLLSDNSAAIRVVGLSEGADRRVLYLDKSLVGIRRLEWGGRDENAAWNFSTFETLPGVGSFPKNLTLEINGTPVAHSTLVRVRPLVGKSLTEMRSELKSADRSGAFASPIETGIKTLLSYR